MSAIADFTLLDISLLDALKEAAVSKKRFLRAPIDAFFDFLKSNGKPLAEYRWSGYVFGTLLPYLEEQGIDLMSSEYDELSTFLTDSRGVTYFLLTNAHKDSYLAKLDLGNFDKEQLRNFYEQFNEEEDEEAGQYMLDAIAVLHQNLESLEKGKIIVFGIV
jgi:hypothetical protein